MTRRARGNAVAWETLENRTLMSATLPAADAATVELHSAVQVHAAAAKKPAFIEPAVNGSASGWKNVSHDPLFGKGGPSINDVQQGSAADCWFLSTLAETAQHDPQQIRQDISQRPDGTYDVNFHTDAGTVDEHIDGLLPVNRQGKLVYAQLGQQSCTWVAIMEKALAYFRNRSIAPAYGTIDYGNDENAMADLGISNSNFVAPPSNGAALFSAAATALAAGDIVEFGTIQSAKSPLVGYHVYAVVAVRQTKAGVEQIEIRNPWAYNSSYQAHSPNYDAKNDGYMWIDSNALLPQIQGLDIGTPGAA